MTKPNVPSGSLPLLPLLPLLFAACSPPANEVSNEAFESLVQSERAFARTSIESGTRAAFLEFFAPDGVVFDAGPVNARSVWESRPAEGPVLSWGPEIADVSAAGDMGYTSGPYTVRMDHESEPVAWGRFVSVWRRNADGTWNVVTDGGITHGPAALSPDSAVLRVGVDSEEEASDVVADVETATDSLRWYDAEYSRSIAEVGFHESLNQFVDPTARFYRNGHLPFVGMEAIGQAPVEVMGPQWVESELRESLVSQSLDLGVTYGTVQFVADSEAAVSFSNVSYYRIWRRAVETGWRVVVDVLIPIPTPNQ